LWATAVCANPIDRLQVASALSPSDSVSPKPGGYTEAKWPIGYEAYSFGGAIVPSNGQVRCSRRGWAPTTPSSLHRRTGAATAATGFKSPKPSACRSPTTSPDSRAGLGRACPVSGHWCLAGSFSCRPPATQASGNSRRRPLAVSFDAQFRRLDVGFFGFLALGGSVEP
jgi:hypothetical protein